MQFTRILIERGIATQRTNAELPNVKHFKDIIYNYIVDHCS